MKPATSNLARTWGLPRHIIKSHWKKSGCGPGVRELPEIRGFPFNISATAEASDFKFGTQPGFAKAHHKITPRWKKWVWPWARGNPQNLGFPFNISTMSEAIDFKFCTQLGFPNAHHKITPIRKSWFGLELGELPKILGVPYNIL